MEIKNKRIAFLGDSITEGYGVKDYRNVYHQIIKEIYGCEACYNYGISGTRIARQANSTLDYTIFDLTFSIRAETMPRDLDLVCVLGGTNDFIHGDSIMGEDDSDSLYTFNGALNELYSKLKRYYKDNLVILIPIHCRSEGEPHNPEGKIFIDYVEAIRKAIKRHNLKSIDLYDEFDFKDEYTDDGGHPNDLGSRELGKLIGKRLLEL